MQRVELLDKNRDGESQTHKREDHVRTWNGVYQQAAVSLFPLGATSRTSFSCSPKQTLWIGPFFPPAPPRHFPPWRRCPCQPSLSQSRILRWHRWAGINGLRTPPVFRPALFSTDWFCRLGRSSRCWHRPAPSLFVRPPRFWQASGHKGTGTSGPWSHPSHQCTPGASQEQAL